MFPSFKFRLARILVSLIPFWSKRKTVSKAQGRLLIEDPAPPVFFRLKRGLLRPNHGFMDPNSLLQQARRKLFGEPSAADLRRWRRAVLKRDGFTCQRCALFSKQPGTLHVHHIVPYAEAPALRTEMSNGITSMSSLPLSKHKKIECLRKRGSCLRAYYLKCRSASKPGGH